MVSCEEEECGFTRSKKGWARSKPRRHRAAAAFPPPLFCHTHFHTKHTHNCTHTQSTMLQRRHSRAQALLVLLLVPVSSFLFTPPRSTTHNMARQLKRPLLVQYANDLEGEGASSTTSTLEVPSPAAVAEVEEVNVEAETEAAR